MTRLYVHAVWAVEHRGSLLPEPMQPRLNGYLRWWCSRAKCLAIAVGGVDDHVHVLVGLHPSVAVAALVRDLKANSSAFVKRELRRPDFAWQACYGAFSVSRDDLDSVARYVRDQPEHHRSGAIWPAFETTSEAVEDP